MGPAGPAGAQYRGVWDVATVYAEHDQITRNGGAFIVPTGTANIAAGNDPNPSGDGRTAANGWVLFAAEGAQGPQGIQGIQGGQGIQGIQGVAGANGTDGSRWFTGHGAPDAGTIAAARAGIDLYMDLDTGATYTFN